MAEGFRRLGKNAGTWGKLSPKEMKLSLYKFGGGSVWAENQEQALRKLRKDLKKQRLNKLLTG